MSEVDGKGKKYMVMKQSHWTPICTMPRRAAPQAMPEISLQQAMSAWLVGSTAMFAMAAMEDRVPSRTHHGDRPAEVACWMILACWGM